MTQEASFQTIEEKLDEWHGRKQTADLLLWLPRGLLAGLLVGVIIAAVARWYPILTNAEVGYAALASAAIGLIATFGYIALQKRTPLQKAQQVDQTYGLQERLTTALELRHGRITAEPHFVQKQLDDAITQAKHINIAERLPLNINTQDWGIILVALLLIGAAVYLPNPQTSPLIQQRAVQEAIEKQISTLEELEQEVLENDALTEEQQEELLETISQAQEALQADDLTAEEGVATLADAEAELRQLAAENDVSQLTEQLQAASSSLAGSQSGQEVGESLGEGNLAEAGQQMSELAEQLPTLTAAEQAELAESLAETSAAVAETDPGLAQQMNEAAEALQNGDTAGAQEALQQASTTLQEAGQQQATAQQAQAAADQLSEGQTAVAQAGQEGTDGETSVEATNDQNGNNGEGQGNQGQNSNGEGEGEGGEGSQQANAGQEGQGDGGQGEGPQGGSASQQNGAGTPGGAGEGGGPAETVFVPEFIDLSGIEGQQVELPTECVVDPTSCGILLEETPTDITDEQAIVPYSEVYGSYRDAAYEALSEDYVPLGLKGYIRDYFSSLEPNTD